MSLKIEKKGYIPKEVKCPNCGSSIILYLDAKGNVHKVHWAELLANNKVRCYCESILAYQPK